MQFLQHHQIDRKRWDDCIGKCSYGLIYSTSDYLDSLCPGWHGLAADDYSWVMPLTSNRKFTIRYLYQPSFTQQTGVFAANDNLLVPWGDIVGLLRARYPFWEISLNFKTPRESLQDLEVQSANNFVLSLTAGYNSIAAGYQNVLKKNLKLAGRTNPAYRHTNYRACIKSYREQYGSRIRHVGPGEYSRFSEFCEKAASRQGVICREMADSEGNSLANILLLFDGRRLYNIMNTTLEQGRKVQANHILLDAVMREFSGQDILFDFEGSDLPGVCAFYRSFGAVNQPYFMVRYNALPWPLRLFK